MRFIYYGDNIELHKKDNTIIKGRVISVADTFLTITDYDNFIWYSDIDCIKNLDRETTTYFDNKGNIIDNNKKETKSRVTHKSTIGDEYSAYSYYRYYDPQDEYPSSH